MRTTCGSRAVEHGAERLAGARLGEGAEQLGGGDEVGAVPFGAGGEGLGAAKEIGALLVGQRGDDGDQRVAGEAIGVEIIGGHQLEQRVERRAGAHLGEQLDQRVEASPRRLLLGPLRRTHRRGPVRCQDGDGALAHRLVLGVEQRQHVLDGERGLHPFEVAEGEVAHQHVRAAQRRARRAGDAVLADAELGEHDQRRAARLDVRPLEQADHPLQGRIHARVPSKLRRLWVAAALGGCRYPDTIRVDIGAPRERNARAFQGGS